MAQINGTPIPDIINVDVTWNPDQGVWEGLVEFANGTVWAGTNGLDGGEDKADPARRNLIHNAKLQMGREVRAARKAAAA